MAAFLYALILCYYSQSYKNHQTASYKLCLTNLSADFYMAVNSNLFIHSIEKAACRVSD